MATERITVTVPEELTVALREIAGRRNESISSIVADAIAQRVRSEALDRFFAEVNDKIGDFSSESLANADMILDRADALMRAPDNLKSAA
jgi:predicted transcriptional regulator